MAKSVLGRGTARARVLEAAVAQFAEHGVSGTSLQMIADSIGVGKASVYYQFHSKEEIVAAAARPLFDDMARVVTIAEAISDRHARREIAVTGLIEYTVRHRRLAAILCGDPALDSLIQSDSDLTDLIDRYGSLLLGTEQGTAGRVVISLLVNGIASAVTDKTLVDVSDAELQRTLLQVAKQLTGTASYFD